MSHSGAGGYQNIGWSKTPKSNFKTKVAQYRLRSVQIVLLGECNLMVVCTWMVVFWMILHSWRMDMEETSLSNQV